MTRHVKVDPMASPQRVQPAPALGGTTDLPATKPAVAVAPTSPSSHAQGLREHRPAVSSPFAEGPASPAGDLRAPRNEAELFVPSVPAAAFSLAEAPAPVFPVPVRLPGVSAAAPAIFVPVSAPPTGGAVASTRLAPASAVAAPIPAVSAGTSAASSPAAPAFASTPTGGTGTTGGAEPAKAAPPAGGETNKAPAADAGAPGPDSAGTEARAKAKESEAPAAPKSADPMSREGELQSSTQAVTIAANTAGGLLGSQPPTYTMDQGYLMPALLLTFGDDNENLKAWTYTRDVGQQFFPSAATVNEGFVGEEGLLCAPDPKGCEGRVLRWFDLGPMPEKYKEAGAYLYRLYTGRLKPEELPKKATYIDVGIGAGNQVKLPQVAARDGHVYHVVLVPEGVPVAIAPVEMNLEEAGALEQFQKYAMSKDYPFVRGILVQAREALRTPLTPATADKWAAPAKLKVLPEGSK